MTHKKFTLILAVIVAAAAAAAYLVPQGRSGKVAEVYSNGSLVRRIDLDKLTEPLTFDVEYDGGHNTVLAETGEICVKSADCPDKLCVTQGRISGGSAPIVCLPNRLVIKITDCTDEGAPDSVSR
ncbi:MAG: NusG domain II-containing protein [Clostridia bacterium]|nr:NusG domain II-containing protein [Clostridia bacterium]